MEDTMSPRRFVPILGAVCLTIPAAVSAAALFSPPEDYEEQEMEGLSR